MSPQKKRQSWTWPHTKKMHYWSKTKKGNKSFATLLLTWALKLHFFILSHPSCLIIYLAFFSPVLFFSFHFFLWRKKKKSSLIFFFVSIEVRDVCAYVYLMMRHEREEIKDLLCSSIFFGVLVDNPIYFMKQVVLTWVIFFFVFFIIFFAHTWISMLHVSPAFVSKCVNHAPIKNIGEDKTHIFFPCAGIKQQNAVMQYMNLAKKNKGSNMIYRMYEFIAHTMAKKNFFVCTQNNNLKCDTWAFYNPDWFLFLLHENNRQKNIIIFYATQLFFLKFLFECSAMHGMWNCWVCYQDIFLLFHFFPLLCKNPWIVAWIKKNKNKYWF